MQAVHEHLDEELAQGRGKGLRMVGKRARNVLTRLRTVRVKRRYYRDKAGKMHFLSGDALGWDKGGLVMTPAMEARALKMCSEISYRKSS